MPDNNPDRYDQHGRNPQSLRLADLARILSLSGPQPVTVAMIEADIAAGAPTNTDGTMNLIHYSAWLAKELKHGGD